MAYKTQMEKAHTLNLKDNHFFTFFHYFLNIYQKSKHSHL